MKWSAVWSLSTWVAEYTTFPANVKMGGLSQNIINWSSVATTQTSYIYNTNPITSHEFGHMLGLWHQEEGSGSLMSYDKNKMSTGLIRSDVAKLIKAY